MKNRKTVVVAFLLIAAMLLGVGYATISDTLVINGTADISEAGAQNAFNDDIRFILAVAHDSDDLASIVQGDDDMASFTAKSLNGADDVAIFTFTIENSGDRDALVTPSLASNDHSEYFDIYSNWRNTEGQIESKILKAGETITYTITVKLLHTPTETLTGSFHINLEAEAIENT